MEPRRRFRFLKELSEGAFGKVYLSEMVTGENFKSVVAIKLLHGKWAGHEEIVQRSRDEARVLGLLHHRNIIRVEDLTSINGQCAVVMEYLDGVDVKSLIGYCRDHDMIFPRKVAFDVVAAIASALEAAYYHKPLQGGEPLLLIHRDIKPSNVMVTVAGDVKVLDFGTAQARFDDREAHTQALSFGSAAYMAPERMLGDPDAPACDVFSLGITLYEMLSLEGFGKINIRPEKHDAKLADLLENLQLDDLEEDLAIQVRAALQMMLAYDGEERPTSTQVGELMEALSDSVHDGSLRRFCREVVKPCKDGFNPDQDPDDPLTGSTLFEDSTNLFKAGADGAVEGVDPNETWVAGADGVPLDTPSDAPSFVDLPVSQSTGGPTAGSDGEVSGARPTAAPHGGASHEVARPARGTPAPTKTPEAASGGRSKLPLVLAVLAVLGLGGGAAAYFSGAFGGGDGSTTTEPETAAVPGEVKGGRVVVGKPGPGRGTVKLVTRPPAHASVTINSTVSEYRLVWDGSGVLELVGLEAGTYRTKIKPRGGSTMRATLEVADNSSCKFTFDLKKGEEWVSTGCE